MAFSGTGGGGGAGSNGWQVAGGQAAGGVDGAGQGGAVAESAAWLTGWEDGGEVVGFVGKGKGRCRDRR